MWHCSKLSPFQTFCSYFDDLIVYRLSLNLNIKAIFLSGLSDIQPEGKAGDPRSKMDTHTCGLVPSPAPRCGWLQGGYASLQIYLLEKIPDLIYYSALGAGSVNIFQLPASYNHSYFKQKALRLPHQRKPSHFQKLLFKEKSHRDLELGLGPKFGFDLFATKSYSGLGFFWVESKYMRWIDHYFICQKMLE